jgi:hypothetical protein
MDEDDRDATGRIDLFDLLGGGVWDRHGANQNTIP